MAETKWTKGPWEWGSVEGGWDGVYEPGGAVVCKLSLNEPANARLIAAAPDLYEALDQLFREYVQIVGSPMASRSPAVAVCMAALARARGEEG